MRDGPIEALDAGRLASTLMSLPSRRASLNVRQRIVEGDDDASSNLNLQSDTPVTPPLEDSTSEVASGLSTARRVSDTSDSSGAVSGDDESSATTVGTLELTPKKAARHSSDASGATAGLHYFPVHVRHSTSLLSLSRHRSQTLSLAGFRHLAMIVLTVGNLRVMWGDYRHYGFMSTLYRLGLSRHDVDLCIALSATIPLHLGAALLIEKFAAASAKHMLAEGTHHRRHLWRLFALLHSINAVMALAVTSCVVYQSMWHPLIGTICETMALLLCLKVASYALTNRDLRDAYVVGRPVPEIYRRSPYPSNLTVGNLAYYWLAPTLIYQPAYPRVPRVRPSFLLHRALEMAGTFVLIWFLSGQYAIPILQTALAHYRDGDIIGVTENVFRLSTVSIVIWLLGFFFIFQSYLNFLAEALRFGDRNFYQDWWNAGSVATYWRLWNKPVTNYFRRHIYVPMLQRGYSAPVASTIVFFVSAVLHEVMVGIPTKNVIGVAFMCMLSQVPLSLMTAPLEKMRGPGTTIGNCLFWLSFFLGQPVAVLMYYFAWNLKHADVVPPA